MTWNTFSFMTFFERRPESRESGKQTDVEGRDMRKRPEKHVKLLVDAEVLRVARITCQLTRFHSLSSANAQETNEIFVSVVVVGNK